LKWFTEAGLYFYKPAFLLDLPLYCLKESAGRMISEKIFSGIWKMKM